MGKGTKGFGYLKKYDPERLKEIAVSGGKARQAKGVGHQWTPAEARARGQSGGQAKWRKARNKGD